jgi:ABC-type branched-subunit amino acid transport system substrate-binding protein
MLVTAIALVVAMVGLGTAGAKDTGTTTTGARAAASTTTPASSSPTASTLPARRAANAGVTATSIKVGGLGSQFLYGDADIGARARFQRANDTGGVNGRKIDYTSIVDDSGDPALDTSAAQQLARQGVFAVVPTVAPDLAGAKVLVQSKIPYFGWALSSNFCGNQYGFGFNGCLLPAGRTSNAWGVVVAKALKTAKSSNTAAILTEDNPSGKYQLSALTAGAKSAKLKVVYGKSSLPVLGAVDYGAVVKEVMASAKGKPPASIFVVGSFSSVAGVQNALRDAGYLGLFTNQLEYAPELVAPATGAFVVIGAAAAETAGTNPPMQQLVTDVQKIAPGQPIDQAVMAGYFSADMFLAAVQKAGKKLTAARLLAAANHNFTYSLPKTVGPTKFPGAHTQPTPCASLVFSNGTAFSVNVPYSCGKVVAF